MTEKTKRRLPLYKAYVFKQGDKDPIIDRIHTMMDDEGVNYTQAAEASGVSRSCLVAWIEGDTMRPQYATIAAVAGALGYEMAWSKKAGNVISIRKRKVA